MQSLVLKAQNQTKANNQDIYFGYDAENKALEIVVEKTSIKPTSEKLFKTWKNRSKNRQVPILVVLIFNERAYLCGPSGEKPPVYSDADISQVERICNSALEEPSRHSANRLLASYLPSLDNQLAGIRNEGFLAANELKYGATKRNDWNKASELAKKSLQGGSKDLLKSLGFILEKNDNFTQFLKFSDKKRALAVLLDSDISPDASNSDFANQSPVSYGLSITSQENLPYLIIQSGGMLRIYPTDTSKGVGRRGRTETYLEINTNVLSDSDAAYLWLIFSGEALKSKGSLNDLIEKSHRFGSELAKGLRNRVYNQVVPDLARGIAQAKQLANPSKNDLDNVYQLSLTILFRLLFIAYAEDRDLLPYKTNEEYRRNSLQTIANNLAKQNGEAGITDQSDSYWQQIKQIFKAVDQGNKVWSVPAYNGGLFSIKPEVSRFGLELEKLVLTNATMLSVLSNLLLSEGEEGIQPVDFRSLSVGEFGSVYEALLETELVFAQEDLVIDKKTSLFRPAKTDEEVIIKANEIFTQNTSGKRKETASYYTKSFAVDHLLDRSLEPALKDHLKRLDAMDDKDAAENFFDIKIADISMGSGHFLVAAIDRVERALENYRNKRSLPEVVAELQKLRTSSKKILGEFGEQYEIEDAQLTRRLIAKRCIFGVDLNPMAVELARLSIWIHTFVPGLPLSFLDRNLVIGNSLTGIGTLDEIKEVIDKVDDDGELTLNMFPIDTESILGDARKHLEKLAKISESSVEDIIRERKAWEDAEQAIAPAKFLCDIICGTRINQTVFPIELLDDWNYYKTNLENSKFLSEAIKGLDIGNIVHFPITFPEVFLRKRSGFDAILGNPPWEKVKTERHQHWARYFPGLRGLTQREREAKITELSETYPELQKKLKQQEKEMSSVRLALLRGPFPGIGTGDPDLYKAFYWRFWHLCAGDEGYIGVVLPGNVFTLKGSEIFRKKILNEAHLIDLTTLQNKSYWVFDMEQRYTIGLVSISKKINSKTRVKIYGPFDSLDNYKVGINKQAANFSIKEISTFTQTSAFPLLPSLKSEEILKQLRKSPSFSSNESKEWEAKPHREMDGTLDKIDKKTRQKLMDLTSVECPDGFWPIYTGASFNLWSADTKEYYAWGDPNILLPWIQNKRIRGKNLPSSKFYNFSNQWIDDEATLSCLSPRISFRGITNRTNSRTVISCLIPPKVFTIAKSPFLLFSKGSASDITFVLGVLSSVPLDWWARRFVETDVAFFIFESFPIPCPNSENIFRKRVIELAGRLACVDERYADWAKEIGVEYGLVPPTEKNDMIHELDAVVAHLYGLSEEQLTHIFETFHVGWNYQDRLDDTLKHFNHWNQKL
jgi:hypothetical protein